MVHFVILPAGSVLLIEGEAINGIICKKAGSVFRRKWLPVLSQSLLSARGLGDRAWAILQAADERGLRSDPEVMKCAYRLGSGSVGDVVEGRRMLALWAREHGVLGSASDQLAPSLGQKARAGQFVLEADKELSQHIGKEMTAEQLGDALVRAALRAGFASVAALPHKAQPTPGRQYPGSFERSFVGDSIFATMGRSIVESTPGWREFSLPEYAGLRLSGATKVSRDEKIYRGQPITFRGHRWNVVISVARGQIYKIIISDFGDDEEGARQLYGTIVGYLEKDIGPRRDATDGATSRIIWECPEGNVIAECFGKLGKWIVNVYLTSASL